MINKLITKFAKDESGVTAVEYGVLAFGLVTAIAVVTSGYGTALGSAFTRVAGLIGVAPTT